MCNEVNMNCNNTICRICLHDQASYPIFEKVENLKQNIHSKISLCLHVTIEDVEGYPRQICKSCNETLDVFCNFINKYKETCNVLEDGLLNFKQEVETYNEYLDQTDDHLKIIDVKTEPDIHLNADSRKQLKISKVDIKRDVIIEKKHVKSKTSSKRKILKNQTNRIASSILEGEFTWTGNKWCLKTSKSVLPTQQTPKQLPRVIKVQIPKLKQPPPPKLCDLCGEVFKDQDKLSIHKRNVHFKKPVKCPKCPRFCVSEYYLRRHIKRKHDSEKQFVCATCDRGFAFRGELASHYKNVHNKDLKPKKVFACKICNKTYKCPKSVVVHERSVHTGDRPAVCSVCGSRFFHEDYLKEHMRLHTGETPFNCPICGRGYAQRCNMKSHLRIHRVSELDAAMLSKLKPNYLKLLKA